MNKNKVSLKEIILQGLLNLFIIVVGVFSASMALLYLPNQSLAYFIALIIIGASIFYTKITYNSRIISKIKNRDFK